jgi:hypothetical protein
MTIGHVFCIIIVEAAKERVAKERGMKPTETINTEHGHA